MARLVTCGFELNSITANMEFGVLATGFGTAASPVHAGGISMQVNGNNASQGVLFQFATANGTGPYFSRVYINIGTAPNIETDIMEWDNLTNSSLAWITLDNSRVLRLKDEDGTIGSPSSALSLNTWYMVEMKVDNSGGAGACIIEGKVDGTAFATASNRSISSNYARFYLGAGILGVDATSSGSWFYDDVAINDNTGSYQTTYPGTGFVKYLHPNAIGDNSQWTLSTGTDNYTCVDETTPNDATDFVSSSTTNQIDDYNIGASGLTTETISVLHVNWRANRSAGTTSSTAVARIKASASGTVDEGTAETASSTTWRTNDMDTNTPYPHALTSYVKPGTSTAWTPTDIDNAQIGARISSGSGDRTFQMSTIWLIMEYAPATGPADDSVFDSLDQQGMRRGVKIWP